VRKDKKGGGLDNGGGCSSVDADDEGKHVISRITASEPLTEPVAVFSEIIHEVIATIAEPLM
jgi:hypothetical protein